MNKAFWLMFFAASVLCGAVLHVASLYVLGRPPARPEIPIPGQQYVSATRDGQVDHTLLYFNLFGFGDRLAKADILAAGSSHVEFGVNTALIAKTLDPQGHKRAFNMGLGNAEGTSFAVTLMKKYTPHPSVLIVDPFASDIGPSSEARATIALTRGEAFRKVFTIWAGFARDWLLQGLLPHTTISLQDGIKMEQPIAVTAIRDWQSADTIAFYSERGEIFRDPSKGHPMGTGPRWRGSDPSPADVQVLKGIGATTIVTIIPYPGFDDELARNMALQIGTKYVQPPADDLLFWDYHHLNQTSRDRVSLALAAAARP